MIMMMTKEGSGLMLVVGMLATGSTGVAATGYQPDQNGAPIDFICAYRSYALEYATKIVPWVDSPTVFDALMLGSLCNQSRPLNRNNKNNKNTSPVPSQGNTIYVSPSGDDSNPGTSASSPKKTVAAGVAATRSMSSPKTLQLLEGTYYLEETLVLSAADSGLTVLGAEGVWISGATPLPKNLKWEEYKVKNASKGTLDVMNNTDNQHGCTPDSITEACSCYSKADVDSCINDFQACSNCTSFAWSGDGGNEQSDSSNWANQCCLRFDGVWNPSSLANHVSGRQSGAHGPLNIWKAVLPTGTTVDQLRIGPHGKRAPRAREPNADPETDQWPVGWVLGAQSFLPPKSPSSDPIIVNVNNSMIDARGSTSFNFYGGGIGGPCEAFSPPFSYWCQAHPAGGGGFQYYVPSGFVYSDGNVPLNATSQIKPEAWTVHMWRRSHWANWMFDVDSVNLSTNTVKFSRGGYQGCRGGPGSDWYIENELAFLDTPGEYFYDEDTNTLYRSFNSTPSADEQMSAPKLQTLLSINGTQNKPVTGLTILNVGFRDAAPTYMEPHGVPSGGDVSLVILLLKYFDTNQLNACGHQWALERRAALFAEGTEGMTISNCTFTRLDGNGLMLSRYHRNASLLHNEFEWTGGSAMAAWGYTDEISDQGIHGWDGRSGEHPAYTLVAGNVIRETGIWEKQSSCWFQAKTARTTLHNNICFNLARAGFNFNDGFGGGDHVYSNLIFNSCRESADHGPINSWDRQPYVTNFGATIGQPTGQMAPRNITRNFLIANYGGSNGAVDNDDGSERYRNNHNFQIYGHQKFKIGSIQSYGNVLAYVSDYGSKWSADGNIPSSPNMMYNNTVIFNPVGSQQYHNDEDWTAYDNKLFGPNVTLSTKKGPITLPQWQALDPAKNDPGSTWSKQIPSGQEIVAWGKALVEAAI